MKRKIDWQQFFISVLGTAIGVALTFIVSGMLERRNKAQAQRLTAIMIIHDIDNTIDILKTWKESALDADRLLNRVLAEKDHLDQIPYDSLAKALDYLSASISEFRFDTSKEQIFNGDVDTWQNLGNMKFIDNVQAFFHQRQSVQEAVNESPIWLEPIPAEEYMQLAMRPDLKTADDYTAIFRPFLQKKLDQDRVIYYINCSTMRLTYLNQLIDFWTTLNNENKFLIGITDQEMEDYITSISSDGIPLSKSKLVGKWQNNTEDGTVEYVFKADKSYIYTNAHSTFAKGLHWSGKLKISFSYTGTWDLQGDSLVLFPSYNVSDVELDSSEFFVEKNMQDSLNTWLAHYHDNTLEQFKELSGQEDRSPFHARLDSSKDKMEWVSPQGKVRYFKRLP